VKQFEKVKSICGACKGDFLNDFCMLFECILAVVFENMFFTAQKLFKGPFSSKGGF
jgi:hypothetical protein